ncbi:MAG: hypothetical protein ABGW69_02965 [Nanoarchaeota archaeon]
MSFIDLILKINQYIPEVAPPEKRLDVFEKIKWTFFVLVLFFILGSIPLFGMEMGVAERFKDIALVLGASIGSIITLGIGPIVSASIITQLAVGSGLIPLDLSNPRDRAVFQAIQRILVFIFIVLESFSFIIVGGVHPRLDIFGSYWLGVFVLALQLIIGGILIYYLDDFLTKYGVIPGVSLFILAGVSKQLIIALLAPHVGAIFKLIQAFSDGNFTLLIVSLATILITIIVFLLANYLSSLKIEVPLSLGQFKGQLIKWPISFLYTSNIPIILLFILVANIQLWSSLLFLKAFGSYENYIKLVQSGHLTLFQEIVRFLGVYSGNQPVGGLVYYLTPPHLLQNGFEGVKTIIRIITYGLFLMVGSVLFAIFWVKNAGMDAESVAKQIVNSGLSIPGVRQDYRVIKRVLERYIMPVTVMGALAVALLAFITDVFGGLVGGISLLLAVTIAYQMYENIVRELMNIDSLVAIVRNVLRKIK